jgi:hypothetical protein
MTRSPAAIAATIAPALSLNCNARSKTRHHRNAIRREAPRSLTMCGVVRSMTNDARECSCTVYPAKIRLSDLHQTIIRRLSQHLTADDLRLRDRWFAPQYRRRANATRALPNC